MKVRSTVDERGPASGVLAEILESNLGAKKKVKAIADALLNGAVRPEDLAGAAARVDGAERGTVLESFELATRTRPALVDAAVFEALLAYGADPAPRVRWEAARTVANAAALHPALHGRAVEALMPNTKHEGTVVRWATAHALTAILRAGHRDDAFVSRLQQTASAERDNGVRGVYEKALRRTRSPHRTRLRAGGDPAFVARWWPWRQWKEICFADGGARN